MEFSVATWNLMLSVKPPIRYNGAKERALRAAAAFYASEAAQQVKIDFVCVQELSVFRREVLSSFVHHPFATKEMKSSLFGKKPRLWPSGLAILSAYPIEREQHFIFQGPTYHVEKIVAKGMLYCSVRIPNGPRVHLFNVHLNAWSTPEAKKARASQIGQIHRWIRELQLPPEEPALLLGDFNIDWFENAQEIEAIGRLLRAQPVHANSGLMFTFDGQTNPLVGLDAPSEYKLAKTGKDCYDDILNEEGCSCCPRQLLDGLLRLQPPPNGDFSLKRGLIFRPTSLSPFEINFNFFTKRMIRDVSDHFAIVYTFRCPGNFSPPSHRSDSWRFPAATSAAGAPFAQKTDVSGSLFCTDDTYPEIGPWATYCPHLARSCVLDSKFEWTYFLLYLPFILLLLFLFSFVLRRWVFGRRGRSNSSAT